MIAAATLLAAVTVFLPSLSPVISPLIVSILVITFAICWPLLVSPAPRWGVSTGLAITGLLSVWVLSSLPIGTTFAETTRDLWLAPVGGAAAFGVLLVFVIQTFTLPGGLKRFLATGMLALGAVIVTTASGWSLLLRHKVEVDAGTGGVELITGVTSFMLTTLAALVVAALATLLPVRRGVRMIPTVGAAIVLAVIAQLVYDGPLAIAALVSAGLAGLIVALADAYSTTREASRVSLQHPMTAVAVGSGVTIVTGMVSYFVVNALPW